MSLFAEAHEAFRCRVRDHVERHLTPHADEWERQAILPASVFRALGEHRFLGVSRSPEYGGQGLDFGFDVVLAEELPRSKMPGLVLSVLAQNSLVAPLLSSLGTERQKREFLAPVIRGEKVGGVASTEPTGGSDIIRATRTHAVSDGDFWVVNGEKTFITNGPIADFLITLVRTREGEGTATFSLLIIPTDTPGFRVRKTLEKLGMHTSPTGWLEFENCRVPKDLTLGKPHLGYFYHTQNLLEERLITGVCAAAIAALVLEETIAFLRQRIAYGQPLSRLQTVRHRVSELATNVEMSRRFVHSVCTSFRNGTVEAREICMIKFKVIEMLQDLVGECLQLHGGYGFMEENWLTRVYRDVRMLSLGGGVSELMKDLVAGYLRL
jgi:acyl-CoA dehydrogenase